MSADLVQSVFAEGFNKELNDARTNLKLLKDEFYETVNAAIALRNATGTSTTFVEYSKNVNAAVKLQKNLADTVDKTRQAEIKLQQEQEKAYNKYLQQLAKEQAEEDKALAKKLAAIQKEDEARAAAAAKRARMNEDDERFNRPRYAENPMFEIGPSTSSNNSGGAIVPDDWAKQSQAAGATAENTTATTANTAAKVDNTTAETENIAAKVESADATMMETSVLLELIEANEVLKAQLVTVNERIKLSSNTDAQLIQRKLELTQAIRQNNIVIEQQTRIENARAGSNVEDIARLKLLRMEYDQLSAAEKRSADGLARLAQIQELAARVKNNGIQTGVVNDQISQIDRVIARFDSLDKIGARVLSNLARHAISFGTSFFVFSAISKGIELLSNYISQLDIFTRSLTEAEIRQKAFADAFKGNEYQTAVKTVYELSENIKLANEGFLDKDKVVDQYNESIGKVTGRVDTLNEVEAVYMKNAQQYIAVTLQKAAANVILTDAAKDAAEIAQKNQEIQDAAIEARKKINDLSKLPNVNTNTNSDDLRTSAQREIDAINEGIKNGQEKIEKNTKDFQDRQTKRMAQIGKLGDLVGANGGGGLGTDRTGVAAQAKIETDIANQQFEEQKKIAQSKIDNDKLSYKTRIAATYDFENAQAQILNNNEALALKDTTLSKDQRVKLENDYQNAVKDAQNNGQKQRLSLQEAWDKDRLAVLKQDIEDLKAADKKVFDNKNQSFDKRVAALNDYQSKSTNLIRIAEKAELKDAGDNEDKKVLIKKKANTAILGVQTEVTGMLNQLVKEQIDANIKMLDERDKKRIESMRVAAQDELALIAKTEQEALEIYADQYSRGVITKKQYEEKKAQVTEDATQDSIKAQIDALQKVLDYEADNLLDTITDEKTMADLKIKLANEVSKAKIKAAEVAAEKQKEITDAEIELRKAAENDALTSIQNIVDANFEAQNQQLNDQSAAIDKQSSAAKDAENNSLDSAKVKADKIAIIDAQATQQKELIAKQQKKIAHDQAVFDREISIARIIAETAENIVKVFPVVPLEIIAAALGALQIATILSTPLPAFQHGGEMAYTGLAKFGESGQELRIEPTGEGSLTPGKTTIGMVRKGTRFIDAETTTKIFTRPDPIKYVGGEQISVKELERLMGKVAKNTEPTTPQKSRIIYPEYWNTDYFKNKIN